jgi:hypothetical protein
VAAADRRAIELHLAACVACSDLVARAQAACPAVDDLTWERTARRLDRRRRPWACAERRATGWSPRLAVAAILALAAGLAWRLAGKPAELVSAVRGTAGIQALAPAAEVESAEAITVFEWVPTLPAATLYRLEIEAGGETLWRETTRESHLLPRPELPAILAAWGEVRWRVVGLGPSGAIALESPWAPLRLRARASSPATPEGNGETGRAGEAGEGGR